MEAKTLQSIKDEIAIKHGYDGWADLCRDNWSELDSVEPYLEEAAELYAKQLALAACEKQREICAESATIQYHYLLSTVDKSSILNAPLAITID